MHEPDNLTNSSNDPVVIIGAGIVGMSCALSLQRAGRAVVVVDHRPPGHGASFGHAGGIAVTWVSPQGLPGLIKRLPGWLIDPLGPVAVRWPYLPRLVPWFLHLRRHSDSAGVRRIGDALASLMTHAWPAWARMLQDVGGGLQELVRHDGALTVYRERSRLDDDRLVWDMRRERGFAVEIVDDEDLRSREPSLATDFTVGVFEPQAKWCEDPMAVMEGIWARMVVNGGSLVSAEASGFRTDGDRVRSIQTSSGAIDVGEVVIAAGAWSHRQAAYLGQRLPLESERGYHVDIPVPGIELRQILSLAPHKMVATPMRSGIRLSGTAEFAGIDSKPDYRRARALVDHARRALPGLKFADASEWAGNRPILPDSLPVIGRDPRFRNVVHAYGHSHIGFTLGPVTGDLVASMITGQGPVVDLEPFRVDRFSRRGAYSGAR